MTVLLRIWKIYIIVINFTKDIQKISLFSLQTDITIINDSFENIDRSLFDISRINKKWFCDLFWCLKVF